MPASPMPELTARYLMARANVVAPRPNPCSAAATLQLSEPITARSPS